MACIVMACIVIAYIVMACIVMACILMAFDVPVSAKNRPCCIVMA